MGSGFWDACRFLNFPYLGMKLGHWPKFQEFPIYFISTSGCRNWVYFPFTDSASEIRDDFQIAIFGHGTWPLTKIPEVHKHFLSTPRGGGGGTLSFISLYKQQFPTYWPTIKMAIYRHETWPLPNLVPVAHIPSFCPTGGAIEHIFSLRSAVSEIRPYFQNSHIWAWNLAIGQNARSCTYIVHTLYPRGSKLSLFSPSSGFRDTGRFSKYFAIFGHETWPWIKVPEVAHIFSTPVESKSSLFLVYGQRRARYRPIFKIAIFGHETCQVAKVLEVAHIHSFYLKASK